MILAIATGIEKKVENQLKKMFAFCRASPAPTTILYKHTLKQGPLFSVGSEMSSSPSPDVHWKRAGRRWDTEHSIRNPGWTGLLWQVRENQERDTGLVEGSE